MARLLRYLGGTTVVGGGSKYVQVSILAMLSTVPLPLWRAVLIVFTSSKSPSLTRGSESCEKKGLEQQDFLSWRHGFVRLNGKDMYALPMDNFCWIHAGRGLCEVHELPQSS